MFSASVLLRFFCFICAFFFCLLRGINKKDSSAATSNFTPTSFGNITRERLLNIETEPGQWLTEGRDFEKSHFSPLKQINKDNITDLGFAWEYLTDTHRGMEANPIVVDGVLYTSGTTGRVYALNAVTGEEIWSFNPESDGQVNRYTCCDEVNRGVAVWDGMVYVASLDGRLFGLDAESGAVAWEVDTFIFKDRAYTSKRSSRSCRQCRSDRQRRC